MQEKNIMFFFCYFHIKFNSIGQRAAAAAKRERKRYPCWSAIFNEKYEKKILYFFWCCFSSLSKMFCALSLKRKYAAKPRDKTFWRRSEKSNGNLFCKFHFAKKLPFITLPLLHVYSQSTQSCLIPVIIESFNLKTATRYWFSKWDGNNWESTLKTIPKTYKLSDLRIFVWENNKYIRRLRQ